MNKTMHIFFNFRNTPCNIHIIKAIQTKMFFKLCKRFEVYNNT